MRKITRTAVVLFALAAGALFATPAHAAGAAVLTTGSVGGANVAVGDVVSSALKSGTQARFVTTSGGATGVFCNTSSFTATILTNPAAGGIATESLTAQTFSSCTSNIFGVTSVQSVIVNNLPYSASVNGAAGTLTLTAPAATPIQATVKLSTLLGTTTCAYRAVGNVLNGTTSNVDNSINFGNQSLTKSSGPGLCPGSSFFTAAYAPARDTTVAGSPSVFVQ